MLQGSFCLNSQIQRVSFCFLSTFLCVLGLLTLVVWQTLLGYRRFVLGPRLRLLVFIEIMVTSSKFTPLDLACLAANISSVKTIPTNSENYKNTRRANISASFAAEDNSLYLLTILISSLSDLITYTVQKHILCWVPR